MSGNASHSISEFELQVFHRIRIAFRTAAGMGWVAIVTILLSRDVPKSTTMGVFGAFKVVAVIGSVWVLFEFVEAFLGRTSFKNPVIDALVTLTMFGLWFIVLAATLSSRTGGRWTFSTLCILMIQSNMSVRPPSGPIFLANYVA